jgi:hypothetical protein
MDRRGLLFISLDAHGVLALHHLLRDVAGELSGGRLAGAQRRRTHFSLPLYFCS